MRGLIMTKFFGHTYFITQAGGFYHDALVLFTNPLMMKN